MAGPYQCNLNLLIQFRAATRLRGRHSMRINRHLAKNICDFWNVLFADFLRREINVLSL